MRWRRGRRLRRAAALVVAMGLGGLAGSASVGKAASTEAAGDRVVIRRTAHGVPHIVASGIRVLGFGYGYAFARDNLCTIADDYVNRRCAAIALVWGARRIRRRVQPREQPGLGPRWTQIIDTRRVERLLARDPPRGPNRFDPRHGFGEAIFGSSYIQVVTRRAGHGCQCASAAATCSATPAVRPS